MKIRINKKYPLTYAVLSHSRYFEVYELKSAAIRELISDPEVRDRLTNNISNLIDANGASRILSAIKENVTTLYT